MYQHLLSVNTGGFEEISDYWDQFNKLKMRKGETAMDFIGRFRHVASELKARKDPPSEAQSISTLLKALPDTQDWKDFCRTTRCDIQADVTYRLTIWISSSGRYFGSIGSRVEVIRRMIMMVMTMVEMRRWRLWVKLEGVYCDYYRIRSYQISPLSFFLSSDCLPSNSSNSGFTPTYPYKQLSFEHHSPPTLLLPPTLEPTLEECFIIVTLVFDIPIELIQTARYPTDLTGERWGLSFMEGSMSMFAVSKILDTLGLPKTTSPASLLKMVVLWEGYQLSVAEVLHYLGWKEASFKNTRSVCEWAQEAALTKQLRQGGQGGQDGQDAMGVLKQLFWPPRQLL
ncbi:hypothetical protein K435DRAFT_809919 [Dendrothele bispora CBS 962.96]|uniref:Uncharacterized protein n=1 Tax=Dendrothele bispora (strain CBS 962.96) TaxID=1314807 RepID=A0A4S8KXU8_DENBC|nr:hypothetical protein K435DRAFT_809919 [Dendrothele bispora CBS 962.96]